MCHPRRAMASSASTSAPLVPRAVDDVARAEGIGIGDIRDLIPKACYVIDPARSWSALASAIARLAVIELILTRIELTWSAHLAWQLPALLVAWLFAGWAFTGLFVIGHDCG